MDSPGSFLTPLNESPQEQIEEAQDDWGEHPDRTFRGPGMSSTQGSPWRSSRRSKMRDSRSAPLLPAANSTCATTWYSASSSASRSFSSQWSPMWTALGGTWRQRSTDEFGSPVRKNADECNTFIQGCVPHWNKLNVRKKKALEHELTWCYYKMRRHNNHPERKEVGDPALPNDRVVEKMRSGTANQFQFWRDLKPPFHVVDVIRDPHEKDAGFHPDGDLFHVTYQCGIDYVGERLWNEKSDGGTFDNMINGVASIRIPDAYPQQRTITMVSWGKPCLNYQPPEQFDEHGQPLSGSFVDPDKWMPISEELGLSAGLPRFAACRESTRKANRMRPLEVAPMQALLLGPHTSLPKLAAVEGKRANSASPTKAMAQHEGLSLSPSKKRQHRIYTAAAGFVRYNG